MKAEVKDGKLLLTTDRGTQEFPLPSPSNYQQGHVLAIPWAGYFVRLRANAEWELTEIVPQVS